jgi:predicted secreted protein
MALFSIYISQLLSHLVQLNMITLKPSTSKVGPFFLSEASGKPNMGYSWQFSLSKGLSFLMDRYYSPEFSKEDERFVVGAVGFYSWVI